MISIRIPLLFFVLFGTGCMGLSVDRLSLSDPRLPVDARRWVADAEDAVVVSRARRDESVRGVKAINRWQQTLMAAPTFNGPKGGAAKMKRDRMSLARVDAAQAELALAQAALNLSKARLQLIYAETAMRQDIAVYNMPPLQAAVDQALQAVVARRDAHRRAREAELKASDAWWTAWQGMVKSKSDTRPFWTTKE
jgi:hypothetical protein